MTPIPSRTFQAVMTESWAMEKAATFSVEAYERKMTTSRACV